jgi:hypothetical protein
VSHARLGPVEAAVEPAGDAVPGERVRLRPVVVAWDRNGGTVSNTVEVAATVELRNPSGQSTAEQASLFTVEVGAAGPRVVTVQPGTRTVLVDGSPFVFKGFNYIGSAIPDRWPTASFAEDLITCENDARLMAGAGVTAVRIWWNQVDSHLRERELACLDIFWSHGIGVVWTLVPPGGAPNTPGWTESYKVVLDEAISRFSLHPATLVWLLGNELEISGGCDTPTCPDDVYGVKGGRVGVLDASLDYVKQRDQNHLVGTTICCPINRITTSNLPALDIWGMNHYPVLHTAGGRAQFKATLDAIATWDVTRPKIFTEQGVDRYWCVMSAPDTRSSAACKTTPGGSPPSSSGEYQQPQADFHGTAWDIITPYLANGTDGAVSGSTTFVLNDMWNRCALFCGGGNTATTHDLGNESIFTAADGTNSAEWWGVAHAIPLNATYTRSTTLAFDALARRWSSVAPPTMTSAPQVSPRLSPCNYDGGQAFRFRARWTTSAPATSEVYLSMPGQALTGGGDAVADNSIYQPAASSSALTTTHDLAFEVPWYGRGTVLVRSFTATGQSVTSEPITLTCGDLSL